MTCLWANLVSQDEVVQIISRHHEEERAALVSEERLLDREIQRWQQEVRNLVGQIRAGEVTTLVASRLAEVQERLAHETPRLAQIRDNLKRLVEWTIPANKVTTMLVKFHGLWLVMTTPEKQKLLNLLIDRIDYDGAVGQVTSTSTRVAWNRC